MAFAFTSYDFVGLRTKPSPIQRSAVLDGRKLAGTPLAPFRTMSICRFALVALLTLGSAAAVSAQPSTAEAIEKGFQALQNGDTDKAASIFRQALTHRPKDPQLLLGAGVVANIQGQEEEAIPLLKQAL